MRLAPAEGDTVEDIRGRTKERTWGDPPTSGSASSPSKKTSFISRTEQEAPVVHQETYEYKKEKEKKEDHYEEISSTSSSLYIAMSSRRE